MENKNPSKMVIFMYPREGRKLTKEEIASEAGINAVMSLMSIGGMISDGRLVFKMAQVPSAESDKLLKVGELPMGWFSGDSKFHIEVKRFVSRDKHNEVYQWAKAEEVPCFQGEIDGEQSVMVIGPYWSKKIDELIGRVVERSSDIRNFATHLPRKTKP